MPDRLGSAFDSPDTKSRYVRRLFSTIADRYDLITVLLSYGQDRRWKRRLVSMAPLSPGVRALDLACGTGDITFALADAGARSVGLDITRAHGRACPRQATARSEPRVSRRRHDGAAVSATRPSTSSRPATAFATCRSLLRRPRRWLACFARVASFCRSTSTVQPIRSSVPSYLAYLTVVGSTLGLVLHGDPDTYRYIPGIDPPLPGGRRRLRHRAGARV